MKETERKAAWLTLNRLSLYNMRAARNLFHSAGKQDPERCLELENPPEGVTRPVFSRIRRSINGYREMSREEAEKLAGSGIGILTPDDENYPELLKSIYAPPFCLYYKGDASGLGSLRAVAVVGSRLCSMTGRRNASALSRDLAASGIGIVSGLARGIDAAAHSGALEAGGFTAAVLGNGLDRVYPAENLDLSARIEKSGVLLSEYPPDTEPARQNFPRRNRIISGMSRGVVVVEAAKRSGSLITANFAMEQGREVFAVPGEINARFSEGTNNLIKQGARLVDNHLDILEALEFESMLPVPDRTEEEKEIPGQREPSAWEREPLTGTEKAVLDFIGMGTRTVEEILDGVDGPVGEIESALLMLELKSRVRQQAGKRFTRI